jgi:hypothetical protein
VLYVLGARTCHGRTVRTAHRGTSGDKTAAKAAAAAGDAKNGGGKKDML